jgi:hypothetical protein
MAVYRSVHHPIVMDDLVNTRKRDHPEGINDEYVDSTETVGGSIILLLNLFVYQQNCLDIQILSCLYKILVTCDYHLHDRTLHEPPTRIFCVVKNS